MSEDKNNVDWKSKFNDMFSTAQAELKKTTQIGMKMLSASQSNSQLHETYKKLGHWVVEQVDNKTLDIDNEEVLAWVEKVKVLEEQLKEYEQEVQDLKKG